VSLMKMTPFAGKSGYLRSCTAVGAERLLAE
jgi:hypothetical protein